MTIKRPSFTQEEALAFHAGPKPGKIEINPTKPMATQRDLSLAYSPGVAVPVRAIAERPDAVYDYTAKGNFVAVISNGTAILGLGDLGALAAKAGDGRQGRSLQALRRRGCDRHRESTRRTSTHSSIACAIWDPASAASIWKTSRRPTASSSKSGCAS